MLAMFSFQKARHHVDSRGTAAMDSIPLIDISSLFGVPCGDRDHTDRQIAEAAADVGFFSARGWPANPNVYRGWFPRQTGFLTSKEGIDMGPDVAYGPSVVSPGDPLREPTPLPPENALPGWRASVADYYHGMV